MQRSRSNPDPLSAMQQTDDDLQQQINTLRGSIGDLFDMFTEGIDITWTDVTSFINGWAGTDVSYVVLVGIIYLKGSVSGGAAGNTAFVLPTGFRPAQDRVFACVGDISVPSIVPVQVGSDGIVQPMTGTVTRVYLDGITYPVEQ